MPLPYLSSAKFASANFQLVAARRPQKASHVLLTAPLPYFGPDQPYPGSTAYSPLYISLPSSLMTTPDPSARFMNDSGSSDTGAPDRSFGAVTDRRSGELTVL